MISDSTSVGGFCISARSGWVRSKIWAQLETDDLSEFSKTLVILDGLAKNA